MCTPQMEKYGATPAWIQWTVVRGDTSTINVEFLQDDETTGFNISGWSFKATAYDPKGDILDELITSSSGHTATITAPASLTGYWGTKYSSVVAELNFDLQVTIPAGIGETEDTVWTPVIGTICVLGDITPGCL